jgi:hypothetical protein
VLHELRTRPAPDVEDGAEAFAPDELRRVVRDVIDAVERHPENAQFHFQLACYECQLGAVEVAKAQLESAVKLNSFLKTQILDEKDLETIRSTLG